MNINLHWVKSVEVSKKRAQGTDVFVRDVRIMTDNGKVVITLFSHDEKSISIKHVKEEVLL